MKLVLLPAVVTTVICTSPLAVAQGLADLEGTVEIDGSSTVAPLTIEVANKFHEVCPKVSVPVAVSGTGGGFKRFTRGETDISNASRPIRMSEIEQARAKGLEFVELPVAYDGLTIAVNRQNSWVDHLTLDELRRIFCDQSTARRWNEVREEWPASEIKIYAPGTDSGTFDYFKEIVAEEGTLRDDMSVSEDDNQLVIAIAKTPDAIGFFGAAYYFSNQDKLKAVPIVNPETGQPVAPTPQTISDGSYAPFSRPLFIYVNGRSARRPEVKVFVRFYLEHAAELAEAANYVRLPDSIYAEALKAFNRRLTGTHFFDERGNAVRGPLTETYLSGTLYE